MTGRADTYERLSMSASFILTADYKILYDTEQAFLRKQLQETLRSLHIKKGGRKGIYSYYQGSEAAFASLFLNKDDIEFLRGLTEAGEHFSRIVSQIFGQFLRIDEDDRRL